MTVIKWGKVSNVELLSALEKEIFRLGLEECPSKTDYINLRDKKISPPPTTVMERTDLSWIQLMKAIGLSYKGANKVEERQFIADGIESMSFEEKMKYFKKYAIKNDITTDQWLTILATTERNNVEVRSIGGYENKKEMFGTTDVDKQLDHLLTYIKMTGIKNTGEYKKFRDKNLTCGMTYIVKNFGGWKGVKKAYLKKYGEILGEE